ncbi:MULTISPECIES: hypothetical protein [Rhizobium/Agrobacterium group]|uniref:hypothetical protein n=1 Tax=Rhizobium/Agrobacterium group TaxID=227290 RepID=UPI0010389AD7|nr:MULTISPECIES: hypothetical protein [Rhizobium/Agrobacterium group]MBY5806111.1 hypothetical protein [Rhizobium leguminosarum]TBY53317.1 hypothetical protein E0H59_18210 [Rhizobium leguminosarum bv. viciae]MBY5846851.1 hypothetical protein [Rhizobium leguminosarum]NEH87924.1 hypothetical protein [Rhizobium ruizarguesonis]NEJ58063.1 hypothetical protein [Rhizobium ruizarguesonis]
MARQTDDERKARQKKRQQQLRDRHRKERRPDRDDVARALLFWAITSYLNEGRADRIDQLSDAAVAVLGDQGFDRRASYDVFDGIVDRYARDDRPFRRKVHLRA